MPPGRDHPADRPPGAVGAVAADPDRPAAGPAPGPCSRARSTGLIGRGSRPVYWCSARYSNETPRNPGGMACPVGVADTLAESRSRRGRRPGRGASAQPEQRDRAPRDPIERGGEAPRAMVAHRADSRADGRPHRHPCPRGPSNFEDDCGSVGAHRSGRDHRLLGRRQVDRDGGVRGRGLLLRGQPALGDDPLAGRAVHARGLEGGQRRGGVRRPRRKLLRGAGRRCSTTCAAAASGTGCCSSRPTSRRC